MIILKGILGTILLILAMATAGAIEDPAHGATLSGYSAKQCDTLYLQMWLTRTVPSAHSALVHEGYANGCLWLGMGG